MVVLDDGCHVARKLSEVINAAANALALAVAAGSPGGADRTDYQVARECGITKARGREQIQSAASAGQAAERS